MKAPNQVQQRLSEMLRGNGIMDQQSAPSMWKQSAAHGLPVQFVLSFMRLKILKKELFTELYVYVPFVCMFVYFYLGNRDITENHFVTQSLKDLTINKIYPDIYKSQSLLLQQLENAQDPDIDIDRTFRDMVSRDQWFTWMSDVFVPGLFDCKKMDVSRSLYAPRGKTTGIGAVRIRALHIRNDTCALNKYHYNMSYVDTITNETFQGVCYGKHDRDKEIKELMCPDLINPAKVVSPLVVYSECSLNQYTTADLGIYHCGGYTVEMPFNATCRSALQVVDYLKNQCDFLRPLSLRFVTVEWFMYTPSLDSFQSGKLFGETSPSGKWLSGQQIRTFQIWTETRMNSTYVDMVFFILVLAYLGRLLLRWFEDFKLEGSIGHFLMNVWNLTDFINIATFFAVFVLRILWITESQTAAGSGVYPAKAEYPNFETVLFYFLAVVYANSFNCVITFLKFLAYLRVSERLGILTRTFATCADALLGVLFIFFLVVLAYALAGIAMFGSNIKDFSNINTSLATMMKMLLGQFDYDSMKEVNPLFGALYFWSYIILGLFLLLNFVLAVVSNAFGDLSQENALVPIDVLVTRQFNEIRQQLHPRCLKKLFLLHAKKKTRAMMLREMIKGIEEHIKLVDADDPDAVIMYYSDFRTWLPEVLCNDMGERYLAIMWDNMRFEYDLSRTTEEYVEQRRLGESIGEGITNVCGAAAAVGPQLLTQVDAMESNVRHVIALLRRHKQQQMVEE